MANSETYTPAKLSVRMWVLTLIFLSVPCLLFALGARGVVLAATAGAILAVHCVQIWLWSRPTRFEIDRETLRIVWPLRRRVIPRAEIVWARILGAKEFRAEFGMTFRNWLGPIGATRYDRLYTSRGGWLDYSYVSRTDQFVLVEMRQGWPLLITPERPEQFVAAMSCLSRQEARAPRSRSRSADRRPGLDGDDRPGLGRGWQPGSRYTLPAREKVDMVRRAQNMRVSAFRTTAPPNRSSMSRRTAPKSPARTGAGSTA